VDFVADAISTLHMKANPEHDTYHLLRATMRRRFGNDQSAGSGAEQARSAVFADLEKPFGSIVNTLANRKGPVGTERR